MLESILFFVTMIVEFILGKLSKNSTFIKNELIPLQNVLIGLVIAVVYYIITKDFSIAVATSGLFAGGTYDILHNIKKICGDDDDISNP